MSLPWIRKNYGVPAYRGHNVVVWYFGKWCHGTITSGTNYVKVRPNRNLNARLICHPTDKDVIRYHCDKWPVLVYP